MNILFALSQVEVTGAEVYAAQAADALIEQGHKVIIVSDTLTKPTRAMHYAVPLHRRSVADRFKNVHMIKRIVREHNIHLIHAHSRASSWVARVVSVLTDVPLVSTVHGRQPTHLSRRLFKAFGEYALPICEAVADNIVNELGVDARTVRVVRNGVALPETSPKYSVEQRSDTRIITLIGRLSKEKGELAFRVLEELMPLLERRSNLVLRVVGGAGSGVLPERFAALSARQPRIEFTGYTENVADYIACSDVVIGAGRSAVEALLLSVPVIAVGEARMHGVVCLESLNEVLRTNFGDIDQMPHQYNNPNFFDWKRFVDELEELLDVLEQRQASCTESPQQKALQERVAVEFSLETLVRTLEMVYQTTLVQYHRVEMPILTYHRVVRTPAEGGKLPIYVTEEQMAAHLQLLHEKGFRTVTFEELLQKPLSERLAAWIDGKRTHTGRWIILSFDDGYEDNYTLLFPLLKRFGMTATIFLVPGCTENSWDTVESSGLPPQPLLNAAQIREMQEYGIEFGSHTMTHPRLTHLRAAQGDDAVRYELVASKQAIEELVGKPVHVLCYPYGDVDEHIKQSVRETGYAFGLASDSGAFALHDDLYEIRRIGVFPSTQRRSFLRKITGRYPLRKMKAQRK
jgi:peptidoglycan/xylan/chitin deacetylase (PgdA/CDA1 family)/glycosyltransferase involved in cell wall biosynthesis